MFWVLPFEYQHVMVVVENDLNKVPYITAKMTYLPISGQGSAVAQW